MRRVLAAATAALLVAGCSSGGHHPSAAQRQTAAACRTLRAWELHPTNPLVPDITQDPVRFTILREAGNTPFAVAFRHWLADLNAVAPYASGADADAIQSACKAAGANTRNLFGSV